MSDNGRMPDGTCECCGSVLHGLYECPMWLFDAEPDTHSHLGKTEACRHQRYASPVDKRVAKRAVRRARRRLEKADPENAPTRLRELTRGWVD